MSFNINGPSNNKPVIREAQNMQNNGGGGNLGYMRRRKKKKSDEDEFQNLEDDSVFSIEKFGGDEQPEENQKPSGVLNKLKNFFVPPKKD